MNYYRKPNKDNYENDIRNLNNKIDIIYTSLGNIIEERNNLLVLFNSRINDNIQMKIFLMMILKLMTIIDLN